MRTQSHSAKPPGNFNNSVSKAVFDFIVIEVRPQNQNSMCRRNKKKYKECLQKNIIEKNL